ncbi:unnamed protein product [Paramecium primaurelia]|uniref:Ubiquitin-like domain-containing protein n=1 Tax=Paramecium primaurelia TaxID=5886 RepID=A0A8S1LA59_PARPR|nr:unnamed protein product [Paramecium primaurelia]
MNILKSVVLLPYNKTFNFEMEANTTVNELLEHLQQSEKILGNTNMWICYSQQRNIQLNSNNIIGNIANEILIVICQKQYEKQKLITISIQPQKIFSQFKASSLFQVQELLNYIRIQYQLNENYQNWECYSENQNRYLEPDEMLGDIEMENLVIFTNKIIIQKRIQIGQNIQFLIEVELNTQILQIFQSIKNHYKLEGDINQWTCYSYQQNQYLDLNSKINQINGEMLLITTQNSIFKTENLFQTSFDIFNTNQTNNNSNQLFQSYNQLQQNDQQKILLNIEILEGVIIRQLLLYFSPHTQIEKVAIAILNYLQINQSQASLDLFINGHQYNNQKDRVQTLYQCGISNNAMVQARVRWLDTKVCLT